jgi:hypothetical protein
VQFVDSSIHGTSHEWKMSNVFSFSGRAVEAKAAPLRPDGCAENSNLFFSM